MSADDMLFADWPEQAPWQLMAEQHRWPEVMVAQQSWPDPSPMPRRFDLFPRLSRLARWVRRA